MDTNNFLKYLQYILLPAYFQKSNVEGIMVLGTWSLKMSINFGLYKTLVILDVNIFPDEAYVEIKVKVILWDNGSKLYRIVDHEHILFSGHFDKLQTSCHVLGCQPTYSLWTEYCVCRQFGEDIWQENAGNESLGYHYNKLDCHNFFYRNMWTVLGMNWCIVGQFSRLLYISFNIKCQCCLFH